MDHLTTLGYQSFRVGHCPDSQQVGRWYDFLNKTFVELDCAPMRANTPVNGNIHTLKTGALRVSRVSSSGATVRRTGAAIDRASEDFMLLSLQIRGRTIVKQCGREAVLGPGTAAFYDSSMPYTLEMPGESEQIVLHVPRALFAVDEKVSTAISVSPATPFAQPFFALALQLARFREGISSEAHITPRGAQVAVELMSLLYETVGDNPVTSFNLELGLTDAALLRRADQLLRQHVTDAEFSPAQLAKLSSVSLRRLQHAYQSKGTTASHQIWDARLELAASLLMTSSPTESITTIACASGFNDFSHFSRRFKARYDATPRDYRRRVSERCPSSAAPHERESAH